jgi:murein DD-endopeptidase MepM/ murein hydrolase activator NlpD
MRQQTYNRRPLLAGAMLALLTALVGTTSVASAAQSVTKIERFEPSSAWVWPVDGPRVISDPYRAPAQSWSAGNRGIDIAPLVSDVVRSPADGVVAFRGIVVDRSLITITHANGLVTTLEPVDSLRSPGDTVRAGDAIGILSTGGSTAAGHLHFGVRWHGNYINPMSLYQSVPRAVLLPCCEPFF